MAQIPIRSVQHARRRTRRHHRAQVALCGILGVASEYSYFGSHHQLCFMSMFRQQDRPSSNSPFAAQPQPEEAGSAPGVETDGSLDPTVKEFETPSRQSCLRDLQIRWQKHVDQLRGTYPQIDVDPFFVTDLQGLLRRYLIAARFDVDEALSRLQATVQWRREWDVLSYYQPGVARELFSEVSNPGAEMYFADSLALDRWGRPYMAGRLRFANAENMHPWRHLRAGVFVFEMLATKVAQIGRGPASYVLDIGSVGNITGTISGTAGLDRNYDESANPYYQAGAGATDAPSRQLLEEFGNLDSGFAVLKAAIQILNRHYPGVVSKVFYLNSDMLFWGAFKVFSRWIADRGSIDFNFLGPAGWREEPINKLQEVYMPEQLFSEWGGAGPSLAGDKFLERAIEYYEASANASTVDCARGLVEAHTEQ